jgi:FO synthase subunit 1
VTDDYINPDYAWPALDELQSIAETARLPLYERLPVYNQYLPDSVRREDVEPAPRPPEPAGNGEKNGWLSTRLETALTERATAGQRYRAVAARQEPLADTQ